MALNSGVGAFDASQTIMSDVQPIIDYMIGEQSKTNAYNSAEAAEQRRFQADQAAAERAFNSAEAAKARDWQEIMSNTAHQREVADLRAAGLNPVLSASGGNGAAIGSGIAASSSGAASGAKGSAGNINAGLVSLFGTLLDNQTKLMMSMNSGYQANNYYDTQLALAELRREWEIQDRAYEEDWYRRKTLIDLEADKQLNAAKPGSGMMAGLLHSLGLDLNPLIPGAPGYGASSGNWIGDVVDGIANAGRTVANWIRGSGSGSSGFSGSSHLSGSYERYRLQNRRANVPRYNSSGSGRR